MQPAADKEIECYLYLKTPWSPLKNQPLKEKQP